jgi:hypothetical protein
VKYRFRTESDFVFNTSSTVQNSSDFYSHWNDGTYDIVILRESSDGSFFTDSSSIGIDGLNTSTFYNVYLGIVPSSITASDYARYIYNLGNRSRTFTQI